MTKIEAILWTNDIDKDGDKATENALQQLAENCVGQIVTYNFNQDHPIGKIISTEYTPGQVVAEIEITHTEIANLIKSGDLKYVGVGGRVVKSHQNEGVVMLWEFEPTVHAIVEKPASDKWRITEIDGVEVEEKENSTKYQYKLNECYFCGITPAFITVEHPTTRKEIFICTDHLESEYKDIPLEMYGHIKDLQFLKDMQLALQEEELRYRMEHGGTYNE